MCLDCHSFKEQFFMNSLYARYQWQQDRVGKPDHAPDDASWKKQVFTRNCFLDQFFQTVETSFSYFISITTCRFALSFYTNCNHLQDEQHSPIHFRFTTLRINKVSITSALLKSNDSCRNLPVIGLLFLWPYKNFLYNFLKKFLSNVLKKLSLCVL